MNKETEKKLTRVIRGYMETNDIEVGGMVKPTGDEILNGLVHGHGENVKWEEEGGGPEVGGEGEREEDE